MSSITIKPAKSVNVLITDDEVYRIIKTGFTRPQTYYVIREDPYQNPFYDVECQLLNELGLESMFSIEETKEIIKALE